MINYDVKSLGAINCAIANTINKVLICIKVC